MSNKTYHNIKPNQALGSIKKIYFQNIENISFIQRARSHVIPSIQTINQIIDEGIPSQYLLFPFLLDEEGWALTLMEHEQGRLIPTTDTLSSFATKTIAVDPLTNYTILIDVVNKSNERQFVEVKVKNPDTLDIIAQVTRLSFRKEQVALTFNASTLSSVLVEIELVNESLEDYIYIEQIEVVKLLNFYCALMATDKAGFKDQKRTSQSGDIWDAEASGTVFGSTIELHRLFSKMTNQRFIALAEDYDCNLRVLGDQENPARFVCNFSTQNTREGMSQYDISFRTSAKHSAFFYKKFEMCCNRVSEPRPWLLHDALDILDVEKSWNTISNTYYRLN